MERGTGSAEQPLVGSVMDREAVRFWVCWLKRASFGGK